MRHTFKIWLLVFFAFAIEFSVAQNFPVRVSPVLTPPYTPFLTDYFDAGSDKLTLQIVLNDITIPEYRCKLRLTIEGVNISITTNPNYAPLPLVLSGGVPEILYGSDISDYFKNSNLVFKGVTQQEFEKKGNQLPEGIYRFSFEVLDYNRGTVVSNKGSATAWMILNDPPFINLPINNAKLKPLNPQNIVFQWTPRHRGSPNAAFTTEYDVKLVEIWPKGRNPFDAINTSLPIFETTSDNTMVVYGPAETPLVLGREYALQVRARDTGGKDLFKNEGRSEVIRFVYGDECPIPSGILVDDISNARARIRWQGNGQNTGYVLRYREQKAGAEWFEESLEQTYFNATGIRSGATYEYQLCGECETFRSEYTKEQTFSTLAENPNAFVCGNPDALVPLAGSGPLPALMSNDFIKAGGFDVVVTHAIGSNGKFSGDGLAIVPWFNGAKVRVTFQNISVNKNYQLTNGFINSLWNKDSKLLLTDENKLTENGTPSSQFKSDVQTFEADTTVLIQGTMITSVFPDPDGNIVVQTTDGGSITLEKGKSYAVADEVGNGYLVDKEGKVTKATATDAIAAGQKSSREYSSDPNVNIRFAKSTEIGGVTKYGFDEKREGTLPQHYQQTENGKWVAWKALSTGQQDVVHVITEGSTDLSKLKFQLEGVSPQTLTPTGQTLTLTGKTNGTIEELLAYAPQQDTAKNDLVAGKLNVVSYEPTASKKLVLIAVNSTTPKFSAATLGGELNKIYSQAVVGWEVNSTIQTLNVTGINENALDDGGSGLLSNYTAEMKQVLNAYLNGNQLADNTYYLFLVNNAKSGDKLGYMPRSKQAGFIFLTPHRSEAEIIHTIAHELGHGVFRLRHTFSEEEFIASQGTTDNLMDYTAGTALNKYQWDDVHNPEAVMGLFEGDEEGAIQRLKIPESWWKYGNPPIVAATDAGFVDAALELVESSGNLFQYLILRLGGFGAMFTPPRYYGQTPGTIMGLQANQLDEPIAQLAGDPKLFITILSGLKQELKDWVGETASLDRQGQYNQGRLAFEAATMLIGVGEVKGVIKGGKSAAGLVALAKQGPKRLGKFITRASKEGISPTPDGDVIRLIGEKGDELGIISDGKLIPTKLVKEGTPLTDAVDGYQLVKNNEQVGFLAVKGLGKFTSKQIDDYVKLATKNASANKVMLGKYDKLRPTSYIQRAGADHTYFDMGAEKWKEAEELVNESDEEMWRINKEFIDRQKALNKEFFFSHEPWKAQSHEYLSKEAEYLIDLGAKDFVKINTDTWRVIW